MSVFVSVLLLGASAWLWRAYMPNAEIWFAEYGAKCLQQYAAKLRALNVRGVSGDQADNATLARWLSETGGNFDVIIVSSWAPHTSPPCYTAALWVGLQGLRPEPPVCNILRGVPP